jgi:serine phosphatase RsbU (regulator of sigma subunit)
VVVGTPTGANGEDGIAALVQEILSGVPGGCTWLQPVQNTAGEVVDFRIGATSGHVQDIFNRGVTRRNARLGELYPSMVGGELWQLYGQVLTTGVSGHLRRFRYQETSAGIVAESLFDVAVSPALGGLLVWWHRVDEDLDRIERTERLGRLGWAEYDLATGESVWSAGMFRIFERDPALGPMSLAEQGAALVAEDRGVSETAWQTLDSGAASDITVRFRLGERLKHVRILSDVARDGQGTPLKIHAVVQDVTAREDSRTEIERLRDQLRSSVMTVLAERRLATHLQHMIQPLPREPRRLAGVEAMIRYLPAESDIHVGGDWYHAETLPHGQVLLAIGDVAGHGLEAAGSMAQLRYALAAWTSIGITEPSALLGYLNRLCVQLQITCTAVLAIHDSATKQLRWSRAGHAPPLLARAGTVHDLGTPAGLLLGADQAAVYEVATSDLTAEDLILFYTDGLVERRGVGIDVVDRVTEILAKASGALDGHSLTRVLAQLNEPSPYDDTCVLAVRVLP